jgi:D-cysteine desulfhydrase family pyridoxal phosphate-dependent enzyme
VESRFDRFTIAHLPTPIEDLEILTRELGGPRLLMKRDDQTGLAFGGNKARKLNYIMADAYAKGADVVITWAGLQSNWCRQTAAAAAMMGMRSILLLSKRDDSPVVIDGNLLLDAVLGADARILPQGTNPSEVAMQIAEEEWAAGNTPYVVSVGGSSTGYDMEEPLGAVGYVIGLVETHRQMEERGAVPDYVVVPTGSGGTQAGLVVAAAALGAGTKIIGISVSGPADAIGRNVARIATETAEALDLRLSFSPDDIIVFDDYVGEGYGILNEPTVNAIQRLAHDEGILLDPVYTGKAMAGLFDLVERGYFEPDDVVVFIHTGGTPAIFHYGDELLEYIR